MYVYRYIYIYIIYIYSLYVYIICTFISHVYMKYVYLYLIAYIWNVSSNICISISFFIFICKKVQLHGTALGTTTVSKKSRKVFLFFLVWYRNVL